MKKNPIPSVVIELFEYNQNTGALTWKKRISRNTQIGKPAGTKRKDKQGLLIQFSHDGRKYRLQGARVIWFLVTGEDPGDLCIDHINGDRNDNRFENLRLVTHQQNTWNRRGVKGYWFNHGRFQVDIRIAGKTKTSGRFKTEEEASAFYQEQCASLRGEFIPAY